MEINKVESNKNNKVNKIKRWFKKKKINQTGKPLARQTKIKDREESTY